MIPSTEVIGWAQHVASILLTMSDTVTTDTPFATSFAPATLMISGNVATMSGDTLAEYGMAADMTVGLVNEENERVFADVAADDIETLLLAGLARVNVSGLQYLAASAGDPERTLVEGPDDMVRMKIARVLFEQIAIEAIAAPLALYQSLARNDAVDIGEALGDWAEQGYTAMHVPRHISEVIEVGDGADYAMAAYLVQGLEVASDHAADGQVGMMAHIRSLAQTARVIAQSA